ncbi:MAG TPA: WD40 repeat domain-containing protein [Longimicrobium sp.]
MRHSFKMIVGTVLAASACRESLIDARPEPGIRFTAGVGSTDTIQATPVQALNVRVNDADGKPAPGAVVRFEAVPSAVGSLPSMTVGTLASTPHLQLAVDTTDASGMASILVRFGIIAGPGKIVVTVPALGFQDTARYTVTPGAAVRTDITPRDTVVYLDGSVTLRVTVVDRFGNWRPEVPTLTGSGGVSVSGQVVRSSSFGRHVLRAAFPGVAADSAYVTALPRGRLAAVRGYMGSTLMITDLDGSNRVFVPMGGTILGIDWAPDGRVVASAWGPNNALPVLQAITPSGQVSPFLTGGSKSDGGETHPVFSADGRTVFFSGLIGNINNARTLWRAFSDGTRGEPFSIPLNLPWGGVFGPSPDGTRLAHAGRIYNLLSQGSTFLPLPGSASMRWSPVEDLIAYNNHSALGVIRPNGGDHRVFSTNYTGSGDLSVDWSGDGKYLVFRSGSGSLELVEVASGAHVVVPFTSDFTQGAFK